MCCHPRWPALEVRAAIVSYINSSFLAKFRFLVSEYMRRCNAVENICIHKGIGLSDRGIFSSKRPRQLFRKCRCPITKTSNSSHFHNPLIFIFILEIKKKIRSPWSHYTTRTATCFVCSTKLSPVRRTQYLDG